MSVVKSFVSPRPTFDFNNDFNSDLLLQNDNGSIVIETQSNLHVTGAYALGGPGVDWHLMGSADFDGDGQSDILLQNSKTSEIVAYLMNGTAIASTYSVGIPGVGWHVRGTGDFNGDGRADIVLQHDNGEMVIWNTDGHTVTGATYLGDPGPDWRVEGVADLNGDGQPDILMQSSATDATAGQLVIYAMNGNEIASGSLFSNQGPRWTLMGTGYGPRGASIMIGNIDNGSVVSYNVVGLTETSVSLVDYAAPLRSAVVGVDFNGDGTSDFALQNPDSSIVGSTLDALGLDKATLVLATPGAGWHPIGQTPTEFIDGTSTNGVVSGTAGADQFDFTSFTSGLHQIINFEMGLDTIVLSQATFANFAAVQAAEQQNGIATTVQLGPGSTLTIMSTNSNPLTAMNIVLR